jgi:hypothetical protein
MGRAMSVLTVVSALAFAAFGCSSDKVPNPTKKAQPEPDIGATSFVSAAFGPGGPDARNTDFLGGTPTDETKGGTDKSVEEGDIYRLMADGRVLNLNPFRGLQVIDVSQLNAPNIVGRARLSGEPVELYVVDDRAIVLLNGWRGYYGNAEVGGVGTVAGGAVLVVDLSVPANPRVVDRVPVGDRIVRSRLTRQGDQVALYVVAEEWEDATGSNGAVVSPGITFTDGLSVSQSPTLVRSFQLVGDKLEKRGELDLGGYVCAIQATTEALLVARMDWQSATTQSNVAVMDISDPTGQLGAMGEVTVPGYVQSQFNMDLFGGVLRVVSGASWGALTINQLATFDATDLSALTPIDTCSFGEGEILFATLFMGHDAFFVTYERVDPFFAFEISAEGFCTLHSEYVVTGWNDFFKPAVDDTRLLGVGVNDEGGSRKVAISLYDITDIDNPEPMIARAEVDLEGSWSEASWDHRAFTVMDDAASATGPNGEAESGLVLVPFSGWNDAEGSVSGVQILTYSADSLTARGVLHHEAPVRRGFPLDANRLAALSDVALQAYDTTDLDSPISGGTVALAPDYGQVLVFGDYAVRVVGSDWYWWYRGFEQQLPDWSIEVVSLANDPDLAPALAVLPIPRGATVHKVGDHLLAGIVSEWKETADNKGQLVGRVEIFDMTSPLAPVLASSFVGVPLGTGSFGYAQPAVDCMDCSGYSAGYSALVVGNALVFIEATNQSEVAGTYESCETYPIGGSGPGTGGGTKPSESDGGSGVVEDGGSVVDADVIEEADGSYLTGNITCVRYGLTEPQCWGAIWECSNDEEGCHEIEPTADQVTTNCRMLPYDRYWQSHTLHVLDLTNPTSPVMASSFVLPPEDAGVGFLIDNGDLYYSFYRPFVVEGDERPYVRFFYRKIDMSQPSTLVMAGEVNVPGRLLAVDGAQVYTQDYVHGTDTVESAVSRLSVSETVATLDARFRLENRAVQGVRLDGAGHVLVIHGDKQMWMQWYAYDMAVAGFGRYGGGYYYSQQGSLKMTLLEEGDLSEISTVDVASWATLHEAVAGRAIFEVPGGVLVMNTEHSSSPTPQAYFPTQGWPSNLVVENGDIVLAAGRYGLYRFDLDETNLLAPR